MELGRQVLRNPKQKRFFTSRDIHDLFTLGDQYSAAGKSAASSETAAIFGSLHGGLEVPLDPDAVAVPVQASEPSPGAAHSQPALLSSPGCLPLLSACSIDCVACMKGSMPWALADVIVTGTAWQRQGRMQKS